MSSGERNVGKTHAEIGRRCGTAKDDFQKLRLVLIVRKYYRQRKAAAMLRT